MFLEIFLKYMYRYTGKSGITIFQFNDIILTSSWHIVKPGFHCSLFLVRNWGGGELHVCGGGSYGPEEKFTHFHCQNLAGLVHYSSCSLSVQLTSGVFGVGRCLF